MSDEQDAAKKEAERIIERFAEVRELGFSITDGQVKACAVICVKEKLKLLQQIKEQLDLTSDLDQNAAEQQKVLAYIKQQS